MNKNLAVALVLTFFAFCTLYTPQPILPLLGEEFGALPAESALLVAFTLLPLGIAPIVYGYFLQAIPARLMLRVGVGLLILDQLAFFAATELWHLYALRFGQGLLLPAIVTALMTYCASITEGGAGDVKKVMGWYVGTTIAGGYCSRLLAGGFAESLGWEWAFGGLGLLLLPVWFGLRYLDADAEINFQRLEVRSIRRALGDKVTRSFYIVVGGVFMVFSGIFNVLPFRLREFAPHLGAGEIALFYSGYLAGIPMAVFAGRILRMVGRGGGVARALMIGIGVNGCGLGLAVLPVEGVVFGAMFLFAAGQFFVHANLSGLVNHLAKEHKGVVNGLYVSVYYLSGTLGSGLFGVVYYFAGWEVLVGLCGVVLVGVGGVARGIRVGVG